MSKPVNIVSLASQSFTPEVIARISRATGADADSTGKAVASMLPTLLDAIATKATTSDGARDVALALARLDLAQTNDEASGSEPSVNGGGPAAGIVERLLGEATVTDVTKRAGKAVSLDGPTLHDVLGQMSPIVAETLARSVPGAPSQTDSLDADDHEAASLAPDDLAAMLAGQKDNIAAALTTTRKTSASKRAPKADGTKPATKRAPRVRKPVPTYDDGLPTRIFKFPSRSYPKSSYYVTGDEIIIRIKKNRQRRVLVFPKAKLPSYRTNRWFTKPRWVEVELPFALALEHGFVEATTDTMSKTPTPESTAIEAFVDTPTEISPADMSVAEVGQHAIDKVEVPNGMAATVDQVVAAAALTSIPRIAMLSVPPGPRTERPVEPEQLSAAKPTPAKPDAPPLIVVDGPTVPRIARVGAPPPPSFEPRPPVVVQRTQPPRPYQQMPKQPLQASPVGASSRPQKATVPDRRARETLEDEEQVDRQPRQILSRRTDEPRTVPFWSLLVPLFATAALSAGALWWLAENDQTADVASAGANTPSVMVARPLPAEVPVSTASIPDAPRAVEAPRAPELPRAPEAVIATPALELKPAAPAGLPPATATQPAGAAPETTDAARVAAERQAAEAARQRADAETRAKQIREQTEAQMAARLAEEERVRKQAAAQQQALAQQQAAADAQQAAAAAAQQQQIQERQTQERLAQERLAQERLAREQAEATAAAARRASDSDRRRAADAAAAAAAAAVASQRSDASPTRGFANCRDMVASAAASIVIRFKPANATLEASSRDALNRLATTIKECPQSRISIEGHTDSDGETARNQSLSERRATAVMRVLVNAGTSSDRLKAVGYGPSRPLVANDTNDNKRRNRRIEFVVEPS